jgi:ankyrin repeat protein
LMIAASRGRPDVARALLAAGAQPSATNSWGLSAVDWAQWSKDPAEMRALFAEHRERT